MTGHHETSQKGVRREHTGKLRADRSSPKKLRKVKTSIAQTPLRNVQKKKNRTTSQNPPPGVWEVVRIFWVFGKFFLGLGCCPNFLGFWDFFLGLGCCWEVGDRFPGGVRILHGTVMRRSLERNQFEIFKLVWQYVCHWFCYNECEFEITVLEAGGVYNCYCLTVHTLQ